MWLKSNAHFHKQTMTGHSDVFLYQCQDSVKLYKQAKFDENIPCGSRVMSLFTKIAQPAKIMLGEASSPFSIPAAEEC